MNDIVNYLLYKWLHNYRNTAGLNVDLGSFFELAELMVGMS